MASYFGVAKEQGVSANELDAVTAIVMAVAAGKVRAQFADARVRHRHEAQ
jgi:hypothetical protein